MRTITITIQTDLSDTQAEWVADKIDMALLDLLPSDSDIDPEYSVTVN